MPPRVRPLPLLGTAVAAAAGARLLGPLGLAGGLGAAALLGVRGEVDLAAGALAGALFGAMGASVARSAFAGPVVPGGRVLSPYGQRTIRGASQFHLGTDIRAPVGTPVHAAHDGVVVGAYPDNALGGYGNTVVLDHESEEYATLYAHMNSIAVERGQRVKAGDVVGTVGSTDSEGGFSSSDAHLHLEVFVVTDGDRVRSFTRFYGGPGWYPDRVDPAAWANEHGVALI